jgi:hypothetical protein
MDASASCVTFAAYVGTIDEVTIEQPASQSEAGDESPRQS